MVETDAEAALGDPHVEVVEDRSCLEGAGEVFHDVCFEVMEVLESGEAAEVVICGEGQICVACWWIMLDKYAMVNRSGDESKFF